MLVWSLARLMIYLWSQDSTTIFDGFWGAWRFFMVSMSWAKNSWGGMPVAGIAATTNVLIIDTPLKSKLP
jgi:hypothetical protein